MQISLPGLLTVIFVIAKILGYLTWSWWWVFSPIWIPLVIVFAIGVGMMLAGGSFLGVVALLDRRQRRKKI
jgi:ABC-type polysaccharide/polyol phosphate export permease